MGEKVTNIAEARYQRNQRLLREEIAAAGQQAAAAFLAHLEAVARGAPQGAVNSRWSAVEERAMAYQELLQAGETALRDGFQSDLGEQIEGEFEADWLESLRAAGLGELRELAADGVAGATIEAGLRLACRHAYRRGYAAGLITTATRVGRDGDG